MADGEHLTDAELVAELQQFGEKVQMPIKYNKRPILLKKLNHYRARSKVSPSKIQPKLNSKQAKTQSSSADRSNNSFLNIPVNNQLPPPTASLASAPRASHSFGLERPGSYNLGTLSSDDSDADTVPSSFPHGSQASSNESNHMNFKTSIRDTSRISNVSDNVLRTLRRRTAELPPRLTRRTQIFELSHENGANESINGGSDDEIPVPSPARSRLYPNLSKLTSFSSTSNIEPDKFESSDSDLDGSSYMVENKSCNTSFKNVSRDSDANKGPGTSQSFGYPSSSSRNTSSLSDSSSFHQRTLPHRRYANAPHRVQQYKSRCIEHLPHLLVAIAVLFFVGLSVTYIVIHKDYFFSWFSSPNYMGSDDILLQCLDGDYSESEDCYEKEEIDIALDVIKGLFTQLSVRKGEVLCNFVKSEATLKATVLRTQIMSKYAQKNVERIFNCSLDHILVNPHWNIKVLQDNGSEADKKSDIYFLESSVASMTLWCRLVRSLNQVLYGIFVVITVIGIIFLLSVYIQYKLRRRENEQKEVYNMVEKIIDMLQEHHEQVKAEDFDEPPYLAVTHVRDQLLPPSQRRQLQPIWDKAVAFIAANESRIRLEPRLIGGEEYEVWHWLQPSVNNGKIWQGQVFGEKSENNSNQVIYSPTPCLKIRNMFDTNMESGENWESSVTDAILEKCKNIKHIVHIYVDVDSREGCVYLKCSSCEAAGKARQSLHGWWFDGRLVTVKHLKLDHYHKRWPDAKHATVPLKPSTDQMKSLSQPYYRSSLEMT
ncbi:unnamed protein product [Lymnaea stagnalis]|uniref:LEM domain-containing protein n=1 Tax=Lymnaea stagnalis TaxID=6523 RepID=A0AAV2HD55_LYMST